MTFPRKSLHEHLAADGRPKRILALDGGGLRGIFSVAILQRIEDLLRARHRASDTFRLCDYFDLIAGTSTGAIIAAGLALGMSVEEIRKQYLVLGESVFEADVFRGCSLFAAARPPGMDVHVRRPGGECDVPPSVCAHRKWTASG